MSVDIATPFPLINIAQQFVHHGIVIAVNPLGNGNINSTFLVKVKPAAIGLASSTTPAKFVLQRINAQVFRQPELVIQNMVVLSEHLKKQGASPDRRWETPTILPTQSGENYWRDSAGEYWRAISFIKDAQPLETVQNTAHAEEIGYALAMFHSLISTLDADSLADTLAGFHITPNYLAEFERSLTQAEDLAQANYPNVDTEIEQRQYCLDFITQRQTWAHVLENAKASGQLKLRPIHGDPKVNNILIGKNGQAVSLIDLDTIKPGLIHYDIGDCLRSGCNRLGEETEDWQNVVFDIDLAKAILRGYLSLASDFLTEQDYDYLYDSIRLIAFELGLRFFTDYLAQNVYFKVKHRRHNLTRSLVQFKLTESIEQQADQLKDIIQALRANTQSHRVSPQPKC
ncbi:MAG: aminoglycoside phosphotransferase [Leptolyngbya foveolarum]|uniref:Aminoglycoside phosphotransferase n=1 Tax=Leptolyngbya foveolarum TaxID=47253 RepID=A0A2W4UMX7_9CYAN|nr:MAG: aminoglycoside phosphotransferase [Leptolyngbya foveolarum]